MLQLASQLMRNAAIAHCGNLRNAAICFNSDGPAGRGTFQRPRSNPAFGWAAWSPRWPLPGYRGELSNDPRSDDGLAVTWDGAVVLIPTLRVTELRGAGADW